jgi:hypothetical protein
VPSERSKRGDLGTAIGNENIGMAGLNMRKEKKILNRRANRIRLTFFIAHINRFSDIRIFKNQYIFECVNLIL